MNDLHHPCERWAEPISLAAAGCLSPDDEREVRRHLQTCSDCRERFGQLTALCGALAEAQWPADGSEASVVERVVSAVASDDSGQHLVRTGVETTHRRLRTRSLDTWRWIMRSRISRVAAAAVVVLAVVGVALWIHGGGAAPALADFIAPILEAKGVTFKITVETNGSPATARTSDVMVLDAARSRQETEIVLPDTSGTQQSNRSKSVMIFDWGRGKSLTLDPATKKALVISVANLTKEQVAQQDMFAWFRSILADARDKPDVQREPLGEREIDGRRVVGFRASNKGMVVSLWGDPKTGLPVRAEATMAMYPNMTMTMSDFRFHVELDESLFSVEPPAGYTVENMTLDVSPSGEKDLIAALRQFSEITGGTLPDSLDLQSMMMTVGKRIGLKAGFEAIREKLASGKEKPSEEQLRKFDELVRKLVDLQEATSGKEKPNEKQIQELQGIEEQMRRMGGLDKLNLGKGKTDKEQVRKAVQAEARKVAEAAVKKSLAAQIPIQRGLLFALMLPADADAHYAGKGVKLGAADKPIFWYRPKDAKTYRVIYADLSVREAEAAPSVRDAQAITSAAGPKK